ncbi:MAG: PspC domain-containing protein [Chloroflexales bacterium]|nr:PspC domain-containing protein [Chloroflexales bacterium]
MTTRLMRSRTDRMFAGVCGGMAEYFAIDATIVRLVFALAVLSGLSPLIYLILWIVMPEAPVAASEADAQRLQSAAEQPHRYDPYTGQPIQ